MAQPEIRIKTVINSRYRIFDKSSCIPFSIVFGFCRLTSAAFPDGDPRAIQISTSGSILDLPYALSRGLLTFRVRDIETDDYRDLSPGELDFSASNEQSNVILPSPVGRKKKWKDALVVYRYCIDPESDFGRMLEVGKKYAIRVKSGGDLGFQNWEYLDSDGSSPEDKNERSPEHPQAPSKAGRWQSGWIRSFQTSTIRANATSTTHSHATIVETLNLGLHPIVVQTRGRQRFLQARGPMLPENGIPGLDSRARIIDANNASAFSKFRVLDSVTKDIVREAGKPGICALSVRHDPRPPLETLVTLKPDEPLARHADLSKLLSKLSDGRFSVQMEPRGMWWCEGTVEDFAAEGEERVPQRCWTPTIPPVILECEDLVELQVENGLAKR